jgi:hypothetical protein
LFHTWPARFETTGQPGSYEVIGTTSTKAHGSNPSADPGSIPSPPESVSEPTRSGRGVDPFRVGLALVLALGVIFRLRRFIAQRSLWTDEAMLGLNVMTRSFAELASELDLLQVAPLGYLWFQRLMFQTGLPVEWALRSYSLLVGIAAICLAIPVARRLIHPAAALPVAGILALSPALIRYADEAKSYVAGPLAFLIIAYLTLRVIDERPRSRLFLGAALLLLPFLSFAAILTGTGAIAAVLVTDWSRRRLLPSTALLIAAWAAASLVQVLTSNSPAIAEGMASFWDGSFLSDLQSRYYLHSRVNGLAYLTLWDGFGPVNSPLWIPLCVLLSGLGLWRAWRTEPAVAALLFCPLVAGVGASALRQYPFALELWLWSLPILAILCVGGLFLFGGPRSRAAEWSFVIAFLAVFAVSRGGRSFELAVDPPPGQHSRPVIAAMNMERSGEPVYVPARAAHAFHVYTTDFAGDLEPLRARMRLASPGGPAFNNDSITRPVGETELERLTEDTPYGPVLFGRSTGFRIRHIDRRSKVDPTWAEAEAERLHRAMGDGCGWLFTSSVYGAERGALIDALAEHHVLVERTIFGDGASASRLCPLARPAHPPVERQASP